MPSHIFSDTRRARVWVVIAALIVSVAGTIAMYFCEPYRRRLLFPIQDATHGLCNATLVHGLIGVALSVGVIVFGLGNLRPRDVGIRRNGLLSAVFCTVGVWLVLQGAALVTALFTDGTVTLHGQWSDKGVPAVMGSLIGQLFGNALYEEIMFRGLLIAQLYFLLDRVLAEQPRKRMALSLVVSQVVFAVTHVPNRLALGRYGDASAILADQSMLVFMGLLLACVYLRTKNLLIAIGIHSLVNYPPMLFASPLDREGWTQGLLVAITVMALLLWPLAERRRIAASGNEARPGF